MNPTLAKLRTQIQQCEQFLALCERIKHLEKLQDGRSELKKIEIQTQKIEILNQLDLVSGEIQNHEAILSSGDRPIGVVEEQQLKGLIKNARIRIGSLRLSVDSSTKEIERIDENTRNNAQELHELYAKLEDGILLEGLDPNTIVEKLADLRQERTTLNEAMKADISTRTRPDTRRETQDKKQPPVEGAPVHESVFYEGLLADFTQAKTSVEIISPFLDTERARQIMTELAQLAAQGRNVIVYTRPPNEQIPHMQSDAQNIITDAHRLLITVIQRSGIQYNAAIIDNVICWEGTINILGTSESHETMRRTVASSHVRELRHFIFNESG